MAKEVISRRKRAGSLMAGYGLSALMVAIAAELVYLGLTASYGGAMAAAFGAGLLSALIGIMIAGAINDEYVGTGFLSKPWFAVMCIMLAGIGAVAIVIGLIIWVVQAFI